MIMINVCPAGADADEGAMSHDHGIFHLDSATRHTLCKVIAALMGGMSKQ